MSEKQSRWGAKTVEGSGHQESIMLDKLREDVLKADEIIKVLYDLYKKKHQIILGEETGRNVKAE